MARTGRLAAIALALSMAPASAAEEARPGPVCELPPLGTASVRDAVDGRTLALADGRTVRLLGLEAEGDEARAALSGLTRGQQAVLKGVASPDRYGRLRARVFVLREGLERSVERDMLRRGVARVLPLAGNRGCTADLLAEEREARAARRGLWGDARFAVRAADDPKAMAADRGRFTLVEGRVRSVRESGGTVYVNFGGRWSEDFTVTIAKRNERMMTAAGLEPKRLEGRRVLVRGWVEERGGPWIDVTTPEQIEIVSGQ